MKYSAEVLGKAILNERKRSGLTQEQLGKKLNVVGKQISDYEKGRVIPPLGNLLKLCDVFGCELGYLLGEESYSAGTRGLTYVSEYLGLSKEAVMIIRKITGKECDQKVISRLTPDYSEILNRLIEASSFEKFVSDLWNLDERYKDLQIQNHSINSEMVKLNNQHSNLINEAFEYVDSPAQHKEGLSEEMLETVQMIDRIIDQKHTADSLDEEIKFSRFKIQETITDLLNSLYLKDDKLT